jgi:hypothetical protein
MSLDLTESSGLVDLKRGVLWGLWQLISSAGLLVRMAVDTALEAIVSGAQREVVLHSNQFLSGTSGGVRGALLLYFPSNPSAGTTIVLHRWDGAAEVTETYTFAAAKTAKFMVAIGGTSAISLTNFVAVVLGESDIWGAVETANLGRFYVANPTGQAVLYQKAPSNTAVDTVYGTAGATVRVCSFSLEGYSTVSATEGNLPGDLGHGAAFGLSRVRACILASEEHRCAEDSLTYAWNKTGQAWRFQWHLNDLGIATFPYPGTTVYLSISGTTAELAADLPAGKYLLCADVDMTFIISASGGGGSAVWQTSPGVWWTAGKEYLLQLRAPKRLAVITNSGAGKLMVAPIFTTPHL